MQHMIRALKERRATAWEEAKAILDKAAGENRDLSGEEESAYQAINADIDQLDLRVKEYTEAEERSAAASAAFDKLLATKQTGPAQGADSQDELRSFLRGERREYVINPTGKVNYRDLTKGTATAGGNTVPTSFYNQLVAHLIEVSGVMQAGPRVLNTTTGENIEVPTTTAHSTGALVTEGSAISESDPAFAKRTLGAYKYGVLIQVSRELLDDTGVDLEGYLAMEAGRSIGNALGVHLVTGDGSSKPTGVATSASTGVTGATTGASGTFTADELIDLQYSVIAPYRNSASCAWLLRDATMARVRKLKDSQNQYLWQPGLQIGTPDMLLGKPVYTDPNVAAVATSAKSVLFGDFSRYFVRLAGGVRFERSDEFAFNSDLVTFRAVLRGDGLLIDQTGAVKAFVGAAT